MIAMTQDRWAAVVCLAFAAFVAVTMPSQTSDRPIPGARGFDILDGAFFPKIAVALFTIAAVWLFIAGRPQRAGGASDTGDLSGPPEGGMGLAASADEPPGLTIGNFLYACVLTLSMLVYVQILPVGGYLVTTMVAVALLALVCGQRSWLGMFVGAVIFPIVVYYLFAEVFRVPLPRAELW